MTDLQQQVQQAIDRLVASGAERGLQVAVYRHGEQVLAAYRPVEYQPTSGVRWGLVAKMNLAEAYAPVMQLQRWLLGLHGVLLLPTLRAQDELTLQAASLERGVGYDR